MEWIKGIHYPEWLTEEGLITLRKQHLLPGETPVELYQRVVNTLTKKLSDNLQKVNYQNHQDFVNEKSKNWYKYIYNGWLCLATPVASNTGTDRGYPISCFIERVPDNLDGIYQKLHEMAMLTKGGGGVGITFDKIRGAGEPISTGGFSDGVIPFMKIYDSGILAANQGNVRRGSASINLPIRHKDIRNFLKVRKPKGDVNRQCLNLNHCVTVDDYFMDDVISGKGDARELYAELISTRLTTGQPYIMFYHNTDNQKPQWFKELNLKIDGTNICCLAGDTEVVTKEGIFKIKDLVGKEVTIFDGENWIKCNNFQSFGEDDVYRIYLKNGDYIDSNSNHKWFIAESYNDIRNNKYKKCLTKNLKVGSWLEFNNSTEYYGTEKLKAAYLKGFLIGDGTHNENSPLLNVHFTKYECLEMLKDSANEITNIEKNTNCISEVSFSEEITNPNQLGRQIFKKMRGLTARKKELLNFASSYKKEIPDFVNLDKQSKLLFISGLLDADGTYSTSGIQITSIHKSFILSLKKLLLSVGVISSIDKTERKEKNIIYRLTIGNYDSYEFFDSLFCKRLKKPSIKPNRRTTGFRKILKIEKLNNKEEVFCPNIPTTGKFLLANGIITGNSEILLPHDPLHTVVCCLSSINLAKYDEWKDEPDFIEDCLLFLDCIIEDFIENAKGEIGFENAVRFSEKSRAVGLGVLGLHTFLQEKQIPFTSISAKSWIRIFSKKFKESGKNYQQKYCFLGKPEWVNNHDARNATLFAIAPTTTNALISGGVSQGIEPIVSNAFVQQSAKGSFIRKNPTFEKLIKEKYPEKDNLQFWNELIVNKGSVQNLDFLTNEEKEVFLTAYEINQMELIRNAAIWYDFVDQGISLNLFFPADINHKWFSDCHIEAWRLGIKTLYYVRTESIASRMMNSSTFSECVSCEG